MIRNSLPAWAAIFALAGLAACGGVTGTTNMASEPEDAAAAARYAEFTGQGRSSADCMATGGTTVAGMPATPHQMEVLNEGEAAAATEPAAGCPDAAGMPATPHQEQLLDDEATEGSSY